jgi:hypothetical protein
MASDVVQQACGKVKLGKPEMRILAWLVADAMGAVRPIEKKLADVRSQVSLCQEGTERPPSGGLERSLLPTGGGYAGGIPLDTEENRTKAAHHTQPTRRENKLALIEPLPLPDDDTGGVPAINGDI